MPLLLQPGKTLSARRWHASFSEEGILDIATVLRRIQRGVSIFHATLFVVVTDCIC